MAVNTTDGGASIDPGATVGYEYDEDAGAAHLGEDARVRSGTVVYGDVVAGDRFTTGHDAVVRERTTMGDDVLVGTRAVIDGETDVGSNVSMQTGVYVPQHSVVGDDVFLGPYAVLTNDPYPLREDVELAGPTVERGASVGANATLLPGVTVGENAFVAAGAVVTRDVPPDTLAVGAPAEHRALPPVLEGGNQR
ncbi:acyltransferase [Halobacterium yunchengense]|uniref:acyltransferase n=1 Tax=Halobacterium yunchengense TaxID=3108497 RepID=UPI00300B8843